MNERTNERTNGPSDGDRQRMDSSEVTHLVQGHELQALEGLGDGHLYGARESLERVQQRPPAGLGRAEHVGRVGRRPRRARQLIEVTVGGAHGRHAHQQRGHLFNGWMGGWVDGWMDGWIHSFIHSFIHPFHKNWGQMS